MARETFGRHPLLWEPGRSGARGRERQDRMNTAYYKIGGKLYRFFPDFGYDSRAEAERARNASRDASKHPHDYRGTIVGRVGDTWYHLSPSGRTLGFD